MTNKKIIRTTEKGRHVYRYSDSMKKYHGLTSILGVINKPWLTNWKLKNPGWRSRGLYAMRIGDNAHLYAQATANHNMKNRDLIIEFLERKRRANRDLGNCFIAFDRFVAEYKPIFLESEIMLLDPVLGFGCTVDAICIIDSDIHVIDYKTSDSISKEYKYQIAVCTDIVSRQLACGRKCIPTIVRIRKNGKMHVNTYENEQQKSLETATYLIKFYNRHMGLE